MLRLSTRIAESGKQREVREAMRLVTLETGTYSRVYK